MFYGDWLHRRAQLSPSKVALIDTLHADQPISYQDWNARANRMAHFLHEGLGIQKGDRIAIYAKNRVEYLDALFAANKVGAILQVLNWRLSAQELAVVVNDASPRVLIYSGDFHPSVNDVRDELPSIETCLALDAGCEEEDPLWLVEQEQWPGFQPPVVPLDWEDPWIICYTGGTTGMPKGAILNYRSITANSLNTIVSWGLRPDDVVPQYMPFFHTGGLQVLTTPLVHLGGTSIVCPGFDVDQLFDQISRFGVTFFFAVPTMFLMMIGHPRWEALDLENVRLVMSGGGACPGVVFDAFREKGVEFKTGYGLTEAGPNTFWLPTEEVERKPGSVGRPLFHIDVKLVDEAGASLGPNKVGHLLIRGPHLFGGYWNNPQATAETIVDGWLHTGDLARFDADGDFTIVDRDKDMIKSGGENIYPAQVEDVMHSHPAIAEAALIAVPDPKWGEVGRAVVSLKPGMLLQEQELILWLREHMAHYKVPKSIVFVDALPKTGANKPDKKLLAETYGAEQGE